MVDNHDQQAMLLVRYEDIIKNKAEEIQRIADFIEVSYDGKIADNLNHIPCTGNSGRQSSTVEKRARRPYGIQLIRDSEKSESYRYLVKQLGYLHLSDKVSIKIKVRACLTDILRKFASYILSVYKFVSAAFNRNS